MLSENINLMYIHTILKYKIKAYCVIQKLKILMFFYYNIRLESKVFMNTWFKKEKSHEELNFCFYEYREFPDFKSLNKKIETIQINTIKQDFDRQGYSNIFFQQL